MEKNRLYIHTLYIKYMSNRNLQPVKCLKQSGAPYWSNESYVLHIYIPIFGWFKIFIIRTSLKSCWGGENEILLLLSFLVSRISPLTLLLCFIFAYIIWLCQIAHLCLHHHVWFILNSCLFSSTVLALVYLPSSFLHDHFHLFPVPRIVCVLARCFTVSTGSLTMDIAS